MDGYARSDGAFDLYEAVRHRLPSASFSAGYEIADTLEDIADRFDVFLLDAFGVLNVGELPIPGAPERVAALQAAGKRVMVVTNAASYGKSVMMERYRRLGFDFAEEDVVSSRDTALSAMRRREERRWGVMAPAAYGVAGLESLGAVLLGEEPEIYDTVDGFLLLGSGDWTRVQQTLLEAALRRSARPLLVGNPDIVAPFEGGLQLQPGHFAHVLADRTGVAPEFFGKPFGAIFEAALSRVDPSLDRRRVLMVGDTLHTDILGGRAAGLCTALVTRHGSLVGMDVDAAIARSGIVPDFVVDRT